MICVKSPHLLLDLWIIPPVPVAPCCWELPFHPVSEHLSTAPDFGRQNRDFRFSANFDPLRLMMSMQGLLVE